MLPLLPILADMRTLLLGLALLTAPAHAMRYPGTTYGTGTEVPSFLKGRWVRTTFVGKYKCHGTHDECPNARKGRVMLEARTEDGNGAGDLTGSVDGTVRFGRGLQTVTCTVQGLLGDSEPQPGARAADAPSVRLCITCDPEAECAWAFSGQR